MDRRRALRSMGVTEPRDAESAPVRRVRPEDRSRRAVPVRACTFDCYGTLIDWQRGIEENLGNRLRAAGLKGSRRVFPVYDAAERELEGSYAPYRDILAASALRAADRLGAPLSDSAAREFATSLPSWPAFPDTAEVLRDLGRRGVRRYILSNVDRDLLSETIRRSSLEVDGVVTAEDVHSYKPAPAHWTRFFRDTSTSPTDVLHVAQSLFHDIVPADALGIRTVWVNRYGLRPPAALRATYTLPDLQGLPSLLTG